LSRPGDGISTGSISDRVNQRRDLDRLDLDGLDQRGISTGSISGGSRQARSPTGSINGGISTGSITDGLDQRGDLDGLDHRQARSAGGSREARSPTGSISGGWGLTDVCGLRVLWGMAKRISDAEFSADEGVAQWRVLFWGAKTLYETGDFATGAEFVAAIAEIADVVGHAPLVDLRPDTVTVQVITPGVGLSDADLELARRISVVAEEMGLVADPSAVQHVQLAFDATDRPAVMDFWQAALGYVPISEEDLIEPNLIGPAAWFQDKDYVPPRNRIHVDISVPHDQAQARIDAILAAGGRVLGDRNAPAWVSLVDIEGNVADIATWQGRD
jgi:4a-hydroxytetrahydrobiopterin dehydratase